MPRLARARTSGSGASRPSTCDERIARGAGRPPGLIFTESPRRRYRARHRHALRWAPMRRTTALTLATGLALAGLAGCAGGPQHPGAGVTGTPPGSHPPAAAALRMPAAPDPDPCVAATVRAMG